MTHPVILAGGGPAVMLGALELAKRGQPTVIVNPAPVWGGHFGGHFTLDRWFDIGMILLEASSFNDDPQADLRTYDQALRNDCGRFFHRVAAVMEDLAPMCSTPQPIMLFRDRFWPDPVLSNHLDFLRAFSEEERQTMAEEFRAALQAMDSGLHARNKTTSTAYEAMCYEKASRFNHGPALHDGFFGPLTQKILGIESKDLLAKFHRIAWLPLYWPETLLANLEGAGSALAETNFVCPREGDVAALIRALALRLKEQPEVAIHREAIQAVAPGPPWRLTLKSGKILEAAQLVWGMEQGALLSLVQGAPPRTLPKASLAVGFVRAPSNMVLKEFSTLFLPDSDKPVYRITNQTVCAGQDSNEHLLVVELNTASLAGEVSVPAIAGIMKSALFSTGTLAGDPDQILMESKVFKNALLLPVAGNLAVFEEELAACRDLSDHLTLVGPAGGFFTASMNDQIVQGLKIGLDLDMKRTPQAWRKIA